MMTSSASNAGLGLESERSVLSIYTVHKVFRILANEGKALDGVGLLV